MPSPLSLACPPRPCPCSRRRVLPCPHLMAHSPPHPPPGHVASPGQRCILGPSLRASPLEREWLTDGAEVIADGTGTWEWRSGGGLSGTQAPCRRLAVARALGLPCQSSVCRKWLPSAPLLCGDSDSGGSVSGDPISASYWAVEPGCRGSSGFPARRGRRQAPSPRMSPWLQQPWPGSDRQGPVCERTPARAQVHARTQTHMPARCSTHVCIFRGAELSSRENIKTTKPRAGRERPWPCTSYRTHLRPL